MTIRIENLSFSYPDGSRALHKLSVVINTGECVAITGHNGSGKTTLVKHLNGLLKPTNGDVWINGNNTRSCKTPQLARQVALLFQNPDDQICKQTVRDEIAFGPKNLGFKREELTTLVNKALFLFDLDKHRDRNPHDLGYSERKRTAMASIVAMDSPIIVFDEPTAGLDNLEIGLLLTVFERLRQQDKTIIVISHDIDFIAENMTRAISLADGEKVFDGPVRNLFQDDSILLQCGLLAPQMTQLSKICGLPSVAMTPQEFIELTNEKTL